MTEENDKKGAAVKVPPPLIALIVLLVTYSIHYLWPIGIGSMPVFKYIGIAIVVLGIGIIIYASIVFKKAETNIEPWKPTTKIISAGLYGYTRNPIYVAFCLIQIGMGIFLNSLWVLSGFIITAILIYHIAIKKEELYLEAKFKEEYVLYKNKVRRWL